MQSKGIIRVLAILIALACIWQLSFTFVARHYDNKAEQISREQAKQKFLEDYTTDPTVSGKQLYVEGNEAYIIDTIASQKKRDYIAGINKKPLYFGFTYKDIKEKELNLGLDLKGGMNITLQVQIEDILVNLAGERADDPAFKEAIETAVKNSADGEDFIQHFEKAWGNKGELAPIFVGKEPTLRGKSNKEVIAYLEERADAAIKSAHNVFENRIKRLGVAQPVIQDVGTSGRIHIELPGVKEPERVNKILRGTASLEFWKTFSGLDIRNSIPEADNYLEENGLADGPAALSSLIRFPDAGMESGACIGYAQDKDTTLVSRYFRELENTGIFPDGFRAYWEVKPSPEIDAQLDFFGLVAMDVEEGTPRLDGSVITKAEPETLNNGKIVVSMVMNRKGSEEWARLTREVVNSQGNKQIAIVLDNLVYSYPVVHEVIEGGRSQISGNFSLAEAQDLVNVLLSGTLPARARVIHNEVVGPSLGQESVNNGLISFAIAFCLVLIYMIFFYQGAGIVADIALLVNVLFLIGTLVSFNLVLTLPGIAGLVLTLGMAVDANVIIYERIKEELAAGKGLGKAVADGYKNAYSAIIDGQVTTLLTGIILFIFGGNGPVAGFATTLIIGIVTSVLTSIFITRIIIDDRLARGKKITFENRLTKSFLKNTKVDFVSKRKFSYIFSGILIVIAIASITFKGFTYGVDFKGGYNFIVKFDQPVKANDVRSSVVSIFEGSSTEVKEFGGNSQLRIQTNFGLNSKEENIDDVVKDKLYEAVLPFYATPITDEEFKKVDEFSPNGIVTSEKVGPSIASETTTNAIISVVLALIVIFCYIAIRFKGLAWGVGGVVSLAHTAIILIGFFSLFTGILPFNLDVDQTFIAAILTIIGYAINDNVVIFDRIREYKGLHPKTPFKETVNTAVNATLTRTVNTSVSSLLPMITIAIFGGESIRGLAVALSLGIIVGTYASIMIGTPIMYDVYTAREARRAKKAAAARR